MSRLPHRLAVLVADLQRPRREDESNVASHEGGRRRSWEQLSVRRHEARESLPDLVVTAHLLPHGQRSGWERALVGAGRGSIMPCMTNNLRCRLGMHQWRKQHNEQGQMYRVCAGCGKYDDPGSRRTVAPGG